MWELDTMSFGQSLIVSAIGMSVVMLALVALALAIIMVSKFFMIIGLGVEKKAEPVVENVIEEEALDEEGYAVLMAAVSEEIQQPMDKFRIVAVKEIN